MPKLRQSVEERADSTLRAGIKGKLILEHGTGDYKELAPVIRKHFNTVYTRIHDPGSFRLDELRRTFNTLHFTDEQILAVFGREKKGGAR